MRAKVKRGVYNLKGLQLVVHSKAVEFGMDGRLIVHECIASEMEEGLMT